MTRAFAVNHQYYTGTGAHILVTKRTAKTATVTQYGVTKRCKIEQWPCGEMIRWDGQMVYANHTGGAHTRLLEKQAAEEREAAGVGQAATISAFMKDFIAKHPVK